MLDSSAKLLLGAVAVAVIAGCAKKAEEAVPDSAPTQAATEGPEIQTVNARGNEPNWSVDVSDAAIVLVTDQGEVRTGAPVLDTVFADASVLYVATAEQGEVAVKVVAAECADSMSGTKHPQSVQVWFGGQEFAGCGGEPAAQPEGGE